MTTINFETSGERPLQLPNVGDLVLFGEKHLFLVACTAHPSCIKLIGLDDGNRWSDVDSLEDAISKIEEDCGKMRIVREADISLKF